MFRNIEDIQKLSELGVLFLLFEMGLELSLDRLKVCSLRHFSRGYQVNLVSLQQVCHDRFNNHSYAAVHFVVLPLLVRGPQLHHIQLKTCSVCRHWPNLPLGWAHCKCYSAH